MDSSMEDRSLAVSLPVPAAAGVDEAFHLEFVSVEYETDEGVVVVELRVGGDDEPWLLRLLPALGDFSAAGGRAAGHEAGQGKSGDDFQIFHVY